MDNESQRLLALINSFPCIKRLGGLSRWDAEYIVDPNGLRAWYGPLSSGERQVIEFGLFIWNESEDWTQFGFCQFRLKHALAGWDPAEMAIFLEWLKNPFFL